MEQFYGLARECKVHAGLKAIAVTVWSPLHVLRERVRVG